MCVQSSQTKKHHQKLMIPILQDYPSCCRICLFRVEEESNLCVQSLADASRIGVSNEKDKDGPAAVPPRRVCQCICAEAMNKIRIRESCLWALGPPKPPLVPTLICRVRSREDRVVGFWWNGGGEGAAGWKRRGAGRKRNDGWVIERCVCVGGDG